MLHIIFFVQFFCEYFLAWSVFRIILYCKHIDESMHLVLALYSKWTYLKNFRHIIFLSIFFLFFQWAVRFFLKQVQVEEYRWCLKQLAKPVLRGLGKFIENFWTLFTKFAVKHWQYCADMVKNFWQHCPNTVQPWLSRFLGTELIGPNKKIGIVIFMIFSFVTKDTFYSVTCYVFQRWSVVELFHSPLPIVYLIVCWKNPGKKSFF